MTTPATPPPMTPEESKAFAKRVAVVGVVDGALILVGIGLYLATDNIVFPVLGALAGAAVMVAFVILPQVRRATDAQKAAHYTKTGKPLVE